MKKRTHRYEADFPCRSKRTYSVGRVINKGRSVDDRWTKLIKLDLASMNVDARTTVPLAVFQIYEDTFS